METATLRKGKIFGPASFYKKALLIALPVMLQMLIQNMVSLIDNFMVSGLGDVKMSGVNISGQILFVFMVLLNTICTAGGIFMSQYYGAGDKRGMRQALSFKAVLAAVAIVLYLLVCMVFPRQILSLMVVGNSQADAILDEAVKYMFLMGFNGIPMAISTICSSSLREIGRVRTPLYISVIATLVNTFFNWVLIYGNLGAPRLEVQGAATCHDHRASHGNDAVSYFHCRQASAVFRYAERACERRFPALLPHAQKRLDGSRLGNALGHFRNGHDRALQWPRRRGRRLRYGGELRHCQSLFRMRSAASQRRPALSSAPRSAAVSWTRPGRKSAGL